MKSKLLTVIILVSIIHTGASQGTVVSKSNVVGFSSSIEIDNSRPSTSDDGFGRIIQIISGIRHKLNRTP